MAIADSQDERGQRTTRIEVLVCFAEGELTAGDVHGTVRKHGEDDEVLPFYGWLQLLGHLEELSGAAPSSRHNDVLTRPVFTQSDPV